MEADRSAPAGAPWTAIQERRPRVPQRGDLAGEDGVPWRDLPERFGSWKTIYNRFSRWARRGVWERIFKALAIEVDETGAPSP